MKYLLSLEGGVELFSSTQLDQEDIMSSAVIKGEPFSIVQLDQETMMSNAVIKTQGWQILHDPMKVRS